MSKIQLREKDLDVMAKAADENLKKLSSQTSYGQPDRPSYRKAAAKKAASPSKSSRKSLSPARSTVTSRAHATANSVRTVDTSELEQKVDFLLKKTKTLEDTIKKLQSSKANEPDCSHNWAIHLSELIKMDKHSIADIREQVTGVKQRVDRIAQRESRDRTKEKLIQDTKIDVGAISEQVFSRVHREFTQVVDEVVRSCVMEQIEALSPAGSQARERHESERALRAQIDEIKRKQEYFEETLNAQGSKFIIFIYFDFNYYIFAVLTNRCCVVLRFVSQEQRIQPRIENCHSENGSRQPIDV
jgi:hypothetical protein